MDCPEEVKCMKQLCNHLQAEGPPGRALGLISNTELLLEDPSMVDCQWYIKQYP